MHDTFGPAATSAHHEAVKRLSVAGLLLLLVLSSVASVASGAQAVPVGRATTAGLVLSGGWTVTNNTSYANTALQVNGSLVVAAGGTLHLRNVTLTLAEPTSLANGIEVQANGTLWAENLTVASSSSGVPLWAQADAGSHLSIRGGSFTDLGGNSQHPGLVLAADSALVQDVRFADYYSAVIVSGTGVKVDHCTFLNSTATSASNYVVTDRASGTGFSLTNSTFRTATNVGALEVSGANARILQNTFRLDANGTNYNPILFAYDSYTGTPNAAGSRFLGNDVEGADVSVDVASNVNISGNVVNDPGPARPFGIHAWVKIGTAPRNWMTGLVIDHNYVSNYTEYGIRVEQNVSHFHVDANTIVHPREPEPAGTPQPNGIYAIRSVNNGTIAGNLIDMYAGPTVPTIGICLESNVSDILVRDNVIYNASQNAINVQGNDGHFDGAPPYETGASLHNTIENNAFLNEVPVHQTTYLVLAIVLWQWANYTVVVNNTFSGWQNVPTNYRYNGAAVLTSCSDGIFSGNLILGATYGFIFTNFGSVKLTGTGTYNRSWNEVYGNALYGITRSAVVEDTSDGMGPITNLLNVLYQTTTAAAAPQVVLESPRSVTQFDVGDQSGVYALGLGTRDLLSPENRLFSTELVQGSWAFYLAVRGNLGSGTLRVSLPQVNASQIAYAIPSAGPLTHSLCLGSSNATYLVTVGNGSGSATSSVASAPGGNATFNTTVLGQVSVTAVMVSSDNGGAGPQPGCAVPFAGSSSRPSGASGATGSSNSQSPVSALPGAWLEGQARTPAGAEVGYVPLIIALATPGSQTAWVAVGTDGAGSFSVAGLDPIHNVTGVRVASPKYIVSSYSWVPVGNGSANLTVRLAGEGVPGGPAPASTPTPRLSWLYLGLAAAALGCVASAVVAVGAGRRRTPARSARAREAPRRARPPR